MRAGADLSIRARFAFVETSRLGPIDAPDPIDPMRLTLLLLSVCFLSADLLLAQDRPETHSVSVDLEAYRVGEDSVRAVLKVGDEGEILGAPVKAFQFEWSLTSNLEYLGLANMSGLASEAGWTVAVNPEKGRVGGFSSSVNAMTMAGDVVVLDLRLLLDDQPAELCLLGVRFNSDNPVAEPESICRVISL